MNDFEIVNDLMERVCSRPFLELTPATFEKLGFLHDVIHKSCHMKINGYSEIFFRKREGGWYLANSLPSGMEQFKGSKTFKYVHEVQDFYYSIYGKELKFKK